jgi:4-amino-4-deoxy-L-arabinose transferase-like glycosyltransferase
MTLPWVLPLLFGLFVTFEKDRPDLRRGRVLFWTFVVGVVVMSLHVQRREYYLIPILAPLGVLMARGTIDVIEKIAASAASRPAGAPARARLLRAIVGVHTLGACITIIAVILFHDPAHRITPLIVAIAGAGIIGAALISRLPARPGVMIAAAAAFWLAIPATAESKLWWRDRRFSLWSFAQHVASAARPGDPVYSVGGLEALFVYALNRPITQVRSLDGIPTPPPGAVTWVIAEPDELADDNPNLHLQKIEQMDDEGSNDEEDLVLLAAVASTPATDTPAPAPGPTTPR